MVGSDKQVGNLEGKFGEEVESRAVENRAVVGRELEKVDKEVEGRAVASMPFERAEHTKVERAVNKQLIEGRN